MPACKFCGQPFTTAANVQKHHSQAPACLKKVDEEFWEVSRVRRERRANPCRPPFTACGNTDFGATFEPEGGFQSPLNFTEDNTIPPYDQLDAETRMDLDIHAEPDNVVDWDATPPTQMVNLEALEEDASVYSRKQVKRTAFPLSNHLKPGHAYGLGTTVFQKIRDDHINKNSQVLGPFKDDAEWELAKWLIKNVGQAQVDTFL